MTVSGINNSQGARPTGGSIPAQKKTVPLGQKALSPLQEADRHIAQQLQEIYSFLVNGEKDGQLQTVNYIGLIGILIKEIQKLKEDVKELKSVNK